MTSCSLSKFKKSKTNWKLGMESKQITKRMRTLTYSSSYTLLTQTSLRTKKKSLENMVKNWNMEMNFYWCILILVYSSKLVKTLKWNTQWRLEEALLGLAIILSFKIIDCMVCCLLMCQSTHFLNFRNILKFRKSQDYTR